MQIELLNHNRPNLIRLWNHQQQAVNLIIEGYARHKSILYTLATGGGKTAIAAHIASHFGGALFITPSSSVTSQIPTEFAKWNNLSCICVGSEEGFASWSPEVVHDHDVVACHRASGYPNADPKDFPLLIIDEAHHAYDINSETNYVTQMTQLVNRFVKARVPVLGITATPRAPSKMVGFNSTWDTLIQGPQWGELALEGILANVDYNPPDANIVEGAGKNRKGDFSDNATYKANIDNPNFTETAISRAKHHIDNGRQVIMYAVNQDHADKLKVLARREGIVAGVLISRYGKSVPQIRQDFRDGFIQLVINVNMVTEGFDCPSAGAIIIVRPTQSLPLFMQMCGRGSRKSDGKDVVYIEDMTDNNKRHTHPLLQRDWSLDPLKNKKGDREGFALECPACGREYHNVGRLLNCLQHDCGAPLWKKCPGEDVPRYWKRFVDKPEGLKGSTESEIESMRQELAEAFDVPLRAIQDWENALVIKKYASLLMRRDWQDGKVHTECDDCRKQRELITDSLDPVLEFIRAIAKNGTPYLRIKIGRGVYNVFANRQPEFFDAVNEAMNEQRRVYAEITGNEYPNIEVKNPVITTGEPAYWESLRIIHRGLKALHFVCVPDDSGAEFGSV